MTTLQQRLHPHPDVVDTELDGHETVLLHLETTRYYSLNATGTRIWKGLRQGLSLQEISEGLQQEFVVQADRADTSVLALADELGRQHLVVSVDGGIVADRRT